MVLAALTADPALVRWRLLADVAQDGRTWSFAWDLSVTATSGMVYYEPGGHGPSNTPVQQLFPQHWTLR
ncbi:hypothetical protein [Actinoplanes auranticolor]|uniref:Uncharacterized protein n=1 Tax=Actinoplanes auranticolor TaxID=47988 RepID=A0A919SB89_9ACTN|nr:hypothetical protein [Actinoplanes auranticolor]GIM69410.1 hypothetical protein Aau02nite_35890 [Actinoplanes auranticolor]